MKLNDLWHRLASRYWDFRLGIETPGKVETTTGDPRWWYSSISYAAIFSILKHLQLARSDIFVDIGCGKGRVICCAAQYELKKVIGIEIDPDLVKVARKNAKNCKSRKSDIQLVESAAQDYPFDEGTVYYLFDPFPPSVLRSVLENLRISLDKNPRTIRVVYVQPTYRDVLQESGFLQEYEVWEAGRMGGLRNRVSFWRTSS